VEVTANGPTPLLCRYRPRSLWLAINPAVYARPVVSVNVPYRYQGACKILKARLSPCVGFRSGTLLSKLAPRATFNYQGAMADRMFSQLPHLRNKSNHRFCYGFPHENDGFAEVANLGSAEITISPASTRAGQVA